MQPQQQITNISNSDIRNINDPDGARYAQADLTFGGSTWIEGDHTGTVYNIETIDGANSVIIHTSSHGMTTRASQTSEDLGRCLQLSGQQADELAQITGSIFGS